MQKSCLSVHNLKKNFLQGGNTIHVLKGIDETFYQGISYALVGASGVGKSTLLHCIAGLEKPSEGYIAYNNQRLDMLSAYEKQIFFNQDIGLVFQYPYLLDELSVLENVMIKAMLAKKDKETCKEQAYSLLKQVGLADKAHVLPMTLSGGQQQRVALARALCNKPTFLLADEPTGNLDARTGHMIIDLVLAYQQEYAMGLIISSHDIYVKKQVNKILELKNGLLQEYQK